MSGNGVRDNMSLPEAELIFKIDAAFKAGNRELCVGLIELLYEALDAQIEDEGDSAFRV